MATVVCCTGPIVPFATLFVRVVTLLLVAKSWLPFTASVLEALSVPACRLVIFTPVTGAPEPPVAPKVTVLPPAESYFTAMLAVLTTSVFSAPSAAPTVVWLLVAPTAPVVLTPLIGWLKPEIAPVEAV